MSTKRVKPPVAPKEVNGGVLWLQLTKAADQPSCFLLAGFPLMAGVPPEDRADALYHSYDGGGVEISGPSILVPEVVER